MSRGKHSAQAEATLQELYHPDRIATPLRRVGERGSGEFESISWDEALNELAGKLSEYMDKPDSVAMITAPLRGALGTVVDRFAENYGARRFSFEAVDQTVVRTAFNRMYGQNRLPSFDVQNAHYVLSFGADFLSHWHAPLHYNWQYGEFRGETGGRGKLVQIEPRFSLTAANADKWVYVNPGTEGVLALAIAKAILENGDGDLDMMAALKETINARSLPMNTVEELTGVKADVIETLAHDFAANQPGVAIGGGLAAAQTNGLYNMTAVYMLNALVGNVGKKGGVIFKPAGAHSQRRQHRAGQPAHGVPALRRRDAARRGQRGARARRRPCSRHASLHAVRPLDARERALHRQLLQFHGRNDPPGGPGPSRSGHAGVLGRRRPGTGPRLRGRRHAAASGHALCRGSRFRRRPPDPRRGDGRPHDPQHAVGQHAGSRSLRRAGALDQEPRLHPAVRKLRGVLGCRAAAGRLVGHQRHGLGAPGARPRTGPGRRLPCVHRFRKSEYPFHLLPFPSHSMGDGSDAHLPWLQATPDPITTAAWSTWVEINPRDADAMDMREGDIVTIESPQGSIEAQVYVNPATAPGTVSVPMGQGHSSFGRYAEGVGSNVMEVLDAASDESTGAFAWGATRVRLAKTGRRKRVIKFEGMVVAVTLPHRTVYEISSGNGVGGH